ncbi:hypothetical protein SPACI_020610 [Sporomusa acidovorans DSM 3132]|uniref:Type II secretion system protein n=1 Tax=Sporomusa acidovorans (strain ATCC 49682 / DSM 3132 / Mol) TaxID=1123286 RepID=A0ABZ3J1E3_SPOA4|nr:hypothetical protein [Sporomusa acidovorans]OZC15024.1 hypothetical protein SPACI_51390 [Sporomusa acidovorans DSM 3132]SDE84260.1 hypothetical protein SAMN04488499_102358 [Sporomusa acidovorans]
MIIKKQQGYFYIDAVIAIAILAVALVSTAGMFFSSTKASASAAHYTAATNIGRQQMEFLKKWKASDWSDPNLPSTLPWQGDFNDLIVNKMAFEVKTDVIQLNAIDPSLIQVNVVVSWREAEGVKTIQFTTFFSKA